MNEEAIFATALELPTADARRAYLDEACAHQPELRAQLESLLQASADAGSFLNHPPLGAEATIAFTGRDDDTVDSHGWAGGLPFLEPCDTPGRLGKLVGKTGEYEIIEVVGQGGMGAVLRAFEIKLGRIVAVKVMAPELAANPTAVKRFLREAQTAAAVHHDHVVTIHAIDETHRPPFLVMQFIEGQTLQQKLDREGALPLRQILRIGSQMAAGLAAAHKHGLIHRDVKPANILLENGVERVKITDFGLARAADDLEMTQTGVIAGTPQYMSPEQAKGEPIDARSDLFSLGSVLYTMCAGRPGFRADNTMAVLRRVCDDDPRPIREVNPEIPTWLEAIVGKLLAKNPADRFQSAAEVAELLGQHLAHVQNPAQIARPATVFAPPAVKTAPLPARTSNSGVTAVVLVLFLVSGLGLPAALATMTLGAWYFRTRVERAATPVQIVNGMSAVQAVENPGDAATAAELFQLASTADSKVPLFNGQDLTGWMTPPDDAGAWTVEDNVLIGRTTNQYLYTTRGDYENFYLRAEVKINRAGDSGILVRMAPPAVSALAKSGYEVQIAGDRNHLTPTATVIRHGSAVDGSGASGQGDLIQPDQWFVLEIVAVGGTLAVAIDGRQATEFRDEAPRNHGHIALQSFSEQTEVMFRKIEIAELRSTVAPPLAAAPFAADQARAHQEAWAAHLGVPVDYTNSIGMQYRLIPPGEFLMGSTQQEVDDLGLALEQAGASDYDKFVARVSSPQHKVRITQPFYFGTHEVTVGQYRQFIEETKYVGSMEQLGVQRFDWKSSAVEPNAESRAAIGVSWDDANAFCKWLSEKEGLSCSLPTEAQWEYACRAGTTTAWSFGDDVSKLADHAVYGRPSFWPAEVVGSKLPNPFGLFDMHGNADEWCLDWHYREFYGQSPVDDPLCQTNPGDKNSGRVARSGTAISKPWWTRSTTRPWDFPATPNTPKGLRVVIAGDLAILRKRLAENRLKADNQPLVITRSTRVFNGESTRGGDQDVFAIEYSPDDDRVATGHFGGSVAIWDLKSGEQVKALSGHTATVHALAFYFPDSLLATGGEDSVIRLWNTETWEEAGQLEGHTGWINLLRFLNRGERLASVSWDFKSQEDNSIRLWNVKDRTETKKLVEWLGSNTQAALSPDGKLMAVADGAAARVRLWNLETGSPAHDFADFPTQPISVTFSPGGTYVAAGYLGNEPKQGVWNDSDNAVVRMWDVASGKLMQEFKGHAGPVMGLEFSPDGRRLLSLASDRHTAAGAFVTSSDHSLRIWNAETGKELIRIEPQSRVNVARWTPDGAAICSGVRLWDVQAALAEGGSEENPAVSGDAQEPLP